MEPWYWTDRRRWRRWQQWVEKELEVGGRAVEEGEKRRRWEEEEEEVGGGIG